MFKILISVITVLAFASSINARPAASAALVGEDLPWQIYNLSINALPVNTTKANETQHITFAAVDNNVNLTFTTTCSRLVPAGQSLFSDGYTRCEFADAGFSLRQDGRLFFHRRFRNNEPFPFNVTTCTGIGDLTKAKIYSHGPQGMTVVDDHMEIACMQMNGR